MRLKEAKNLQIDDWITCGTSSPFQIKSIQSEWCGVIVEDFYGMSARYTALFPLQLTESIFKANGFSQQKGFKVWTKEVNNKEGQVVASIEVTMLLYPETSIYCKINSNAYLLPCYFVKFVKYTHEFQHLLRQAGMYELANKFKIC